MVEIALHVAGGFLLFAAAGALCLGAADDPRGRKLGAIGHGEEAAHFTFTFTVFEQTAVPVRHTR